MDKQKPWCPFTIKSNGFRTLIESFQLAKKQTVQIIKPKSIPKYFKERIKLLQQKK
jgi:hypothetical protein